MLIKKIIACSTFALLTVQVALADYSNRGRPWDAPSYHESPLSYVFLFIALIVVLIFGIAWLVDTVKRNKEKIVDTLGLIFVAALFLGVIFIVGTCASMLKNDKKSEADKSPSMSMPTPNMPSQNASSPQMTNPQSDQATQISTPTLKYRTVYVDCFACNGTGKVVCSKCHGTGWIEKICHVCKGVGVFGTNNCIYCQGKGYNEDIISGERLNCFSCGGTGQVKNECYFCSGSGKDGESCGLVGLNETHYVTCENCNGFGTIKQTIQEGYYE